MTATRRHRKHRTEDPTVRTILSVTVVAVLLVSLVKNSAAQQFNQAPYLQNAIPIADDRWPPSPVTEQAWIGYRIGMLEGISFREQHLNQDALVVLLNDNASELPGVRPCGLKVQYSDSFGKFAIGVSHADPAVRVACLREVVTYLLRQPIAELDFRSTDKAEAYWRRMGFSALAYAQQLALLSIYERYSPLFQVHSVGKKDFAELSFEDFRSWLRRSREQRLIAFDGKRALLEALGLPVPDPMIARLVPSLKSERVPAGTLYFEGEKIGVPALIMIKLAGAPDSVDLLAAERLGCGSEDGKKHHSIAPPGEAISRVVCEWYDWYGDVWLGLGVLKSGQVNDQDFCQQIPAVTSDPIVAAFVRSTPEGQSGMYVLLPRRCGA